MVAQPIERSRAADFFQIAEDRDEQLELIEGVIIVMSGPTPKHQSLVLAAAMLLQTLSNTLGGRVYIAPLEVHLDDENVVQPDVMWVAPQSRCLVTERRLEGPPDLVVEVLSPSTAKRDKNEKFKLYERCGVREYWILDPDRLFIEVWLLAESFFRLQGIYSPGEKFHSPVLSGREIDTAALIPLASE